MRRGEVKGSTCKYSKKEEERGGEVKREGGGYIPVPVLRILRIIGVLYVYIYLRLRISFMYLCATHSMSVIFNTTSTYL